MPKPKLLPKGVPKHVPQMDFDEIVLFEPKGVSDKLPEKFPEREPPGKGTLADKTLERSPVPESMTKVEEIPKMVVVEEVHEKVAGKPPTIVPEKVTLQRKLLEEEKTHEKLPAELPVKVEKVKPDMSSKKDTEKTSMEKLPSKVPGKRPKTAPEAQPEKGVEALKEPTTGKIEVMSTSESCQVGPFRAVTHKWAFYICCFFGVLIFETLCLLDIFVLGLLEIIEK